MFVAGVGGRGLVGARGLGDVYESVVWRVCVWCVCVVCSV